MTKIYDSKFEKTVEKKLGIKKNTKSKVLYTTSHTYTPDFIGSDGTIYEAKGYLRPSDRSKMIAVKKANPHLTICFVFQRPNNTISKTSKTTYSAWATKNGFKWVQG